MDDEEPILFAMGEYFSSLRYQVDRARSLDGARSLLSRRPDVAILDLRLNGAKAAEGLQVATLLRAQDPHVPIILMTGFGPKPIKPRRSGSVSTLSSLSPSLSPSSVGG